MAVNKHNLILLYGGKSGEHEVSLASAASVLAHLDTEKFNIIPIGIDKKGCFFRNDYHALAACTDRLPVKTDKAVKLPSLLVDGKLAIDADVVFPVVHGPLYEDGCLQGLLELAGVAYVGCDVLTSAIGMDKDICKRLACGNGIQSAHYRVLSWHSDGDMRQRFCRETAADLGWPLFVKPGALGSSVGIHKVNTMQELEQAVDDALRYDESILVEEFIDGQEIELAVLENSNPAEEPHVSVPGEIKTHHADGFYSYAAKYLQVDTLELLIPASLDAEMINRLQKAAQTIFTRLKCKGMARVDFFVNQRNQSIHFNEVNTIPGFTSLSMYPKLWQASGLKYTQLLEKLIQLALIHHHCREQLLTEINN